MAICAKLLRTAEPSYCAVRTPTRNIPVHRAIYAEIIEDIHPLINEHLSFDDLIALMRVDHAHRRVVLSAIFTRLFWKDQQKKLGYHLGGSCSLDDQTLNQIFDKAYHITIIPPIIHKILENRIKILERNEEGYLHPVAILKATRTFLKWYHAHDKQTSFYLQNVLFQCGYQMFRADAREFNNFLKERS
ncbi:MAG: hypothetical protein JSS10_00135 [Verrucomicrobia bacterium]|nr:hypothetical protein [Verrucomicrobiota bacterium]